MYSSIVVCLSWQIYIATAAYIYICIYSAKIFMAFADLSQTVKIKPCENFQQQVSGRVW